MGLWLDSEVGVWVLGLRFFVVVGYDVTVYYLGFFFGYVFAVMKRFCWLNSTIFIYILTHIFFTLLFIFLVSYYCYFFF